MELQLAADARIRVESRRARNVRQHLLQIIRVALPVLRVVQQHVHVEENVLLRDPHIPVVLPVRGQRRVHDVIDAAVAVQDHGDRCADSRLRNRNVPKLAISDAPVSGVLAPISRSALLLQGNYGVVEAEHALLLRVGSNAGVVQGGILIAAEGEDCLIHVDGVEDSEVHEQVEVSHR